MIDARPSVKLPSALSEGGVVMLASTCLGQPAVKWRRVGGSAPDTPGKVCDGSFFDLWRSPSHRTSSITMLDGGG